MEEEEGEGLTPFWMQRTTNRRSYRICNGLSSTFFSSGLLISILLVTAISFLVFVVPSTLSSFSSRIFKTNSVKKSWDSINVLLVLVALLFGFLSRATNNNNQKDESHHQTSSPVFRNIGTRKSNPPNEAQRSNHDLSSQRWYEYSDNLASYNNPATVITTRCGLTRTSSSYPDLLVQASPRFMSGDDDPWRFYDDTGVDTYQLPTETGRRKSWKNKFADPPRMTETKNNIYVDTFLNPPPNEASNLSPSTSPSPSRSPPASLQQPSSSALPEEKLKRGYRRVEQKGERIIKRKGDINELEDKEPISSPSVDQKRSKTDKKKRSGGNSTKDFWNTLYHKKKKKQRQKSIENFEALLHQPQSVPLLRFELPQAYRSPPPSVFNHLFSANKSKRRDQDISASKSSSSQLNPAATTHLVPEPSTSQSKPVTSQKCRKPIKIRSFDSVEENSNSGGESPLIPIPPPPPPFAKSLSWKFVVQGDYVRVNSSISSRSVSPDSEETESEGTPETPIDGAHVTPLFFPSPDVNTKAENFITKFRAELKLEKINSMNNKRQGLGMSSLSRVSGRSTPL